MALTRAVEQGGTGDRRELVLSDVEAWVRAMREAGAGDAERFIVGVTRRGRCTALYAWPAEQPEKAGKHRLKDSP